MSECDECEKKNRESKLLLKFFVLILLAENIVLESIRPVPYGGPLLTALLAFVLGWTMGRK